MMQEPIVTTMVDQIHSDRSKIFESLLKWPIEVVALPLKLSPK